MDCPSCGHGNREGARFCAECATPLIDAVTCPSCGAIHPAGTKFCDGCGRPLMDASEPTEVLGRRMQPPEHLADKIRAERASLEGERKQVTVLFADVIGSMELAEQSDPEEWRRIMDRFFMILSAGVHRFEGTVDKFTGDGIMALFGAPIAHEDHAQRACYAALHLQRELATYAAELRRAQGLSLAVRIGLNSGEVVVGAIGEDLAMDYTAVGHTVGLAQRMEQLAEPGRAYVTQHTASLVEGYLALRDLGEFQVKGASRPLRVHELTGVGAARGRLDVSRARGFSRFVGRDDELRVLESALEQAQGGHGQVIGVVGEAGVGKSRLCHEFAERQRARGKPVYHLAGQAHAKSVPLLPVLQFLRAYFDISERDSDRTARERIAGKLVLLDKSFEEDLPLIFDFLAVPDPERPAPHMDPEARQRQVLAVMKRLTRAESAREPGMAVFEDLHWLDPASEVFLANYVEAVQGTRGLTVLNFRPEYRADWMSRSYYRQIALAPLGAEAIAEMLAGLLGSDPSLDGLPDLVRERTGGNPFFIEELVQSLVEAGTLEGQRGAYRLVRPVEEAAVPASVQAVLAARIDRLSQREKMVLQAAAVIGKEFAQPVLSSVVELSTPELEHALRELVAGEFVYEQEVYPEPVYAFKHPLTQEVAYGSQLGERRASTHAAVARAIAADNPERLDERAALLAQHWEAAGEQLEAARAHARAAGWSGTRDPRQAMWHWDRLRELTDALPDSPETVALGLGARTSSLAFGWRLGIAPEEADAIFREAERMAAAAGNVRVRAMLLSGYGAVKGLGDGDMHAFAELSRRAIALAEESGDAALYLGITPVVYSFFCTGAFQEGVAMLDRAIELAHGDPTVGAGAGIACPYAFCHGHKGWILSFLGRFDEAQQLLEQARRIAHDQGDIETIGWCHGWSAWITHFKGERESTLAHSQQALDIAERIGNAYSRSYAWYSVGRAEAARGEWRRAIEAGESSQSIAREIRTAVEIEGLRLAVLAEAHLGLGEAERARALAEEAVAIAHTPVVETEANLALARVLLGSTGSTARDEIERVLARALEVTRDTGAMVYEPLIHLELGELAAQIGDEERREQELCEAQRLFAEIGATSRADRLAAELALPTS
jgi:class 3 adenylate cyclase/tetratricopeptide (TPR) repeat protein